MSLTLATPVTVVSRSASFRGSTYLGNIPFDISAQFYGPDVVLSKAVNKKTVKTAVILGFFTALLVCSGSLKRTTYFFSTE